MPRENFNDLAAFLAVARERSFTRAAAKLGVSQSALSHTIRGLEERLGLRLLTRTTRSISPTEAGERLLQTVGPRFEEIETELAGLSELRRKPAGTIRITATQYAVDYDSLAQATESPPRISGHQARRSSTNRASSILLPNTMTPACARARGGEGHDRSPHRTGHADGSCRRSSLLRESIGAEETPRPDAHNCINFRLPTSAGCMPGNSKKASRQLKVRVEGQLAFNDTSQMLSAALAGFGLAYVPEDFGCSRYIAKDRLKRVLEDWCPPFSGYHLYYPSRRQLTPAFAVLVEALRYRR